MGMLKIIRMSGTFFKTDGPKPREKSVLDGRELVEREFSGLSFENEEQRLKFLNFVFYVRSQVDLCRQTGFCMGMPYDSGLRCGVGNGIKPIYRCGPGFESPCEYMKMENVIIGKPDKKGLIIRCLAPLANNA